MAGVKVYLGMGADDGTDGDRILRALSGGTDAGERIDMLIQPAPIAQAGAGGECLYRRLFIPITHTMGGDLLVTPIVDGVDLVTRTVALEASVARTYRMLEVSIAVPFSDGATEVGKVGARGTWFSFRIEKEGVSNDAADPAVPGELIVNEVEVEFDVVRDSSAADAV